MLPYLFKDPKLYYQRKEIKSDIDNKKHVYRTYEYYRHTLPLV